MVSIYINAIIINSYYTLYSYTFISTFFYFTQSFFPFSYFPFPPLEIIFSNPDKLVNEVNPIPRPPPIEVILPGPVKPVRLRKVDVFIKGPGAGREAAIRALNTAGLSIMSIKDITPIPHNGCRPPKRRRV